jgi:hypothetical protein
MASDAYLRLSRIVVYRLSSLSCASAYMGTPLHEYHSLLLARRSVKDCPSSSAPLLKVGDGGVVVRVYFHVFLTQVMRIGSMRSVYIQSPKKSETEQKKNEVRTCAPLMPRGTRGKLKNADREMPGCSMDQL